MKNDDNKILAVPTNIITGFLGVGKTSAIMQLLQQKPQNERWAVLVNEFGEIGVDGSLFEGNTVTKNSVFIKEVPGGCMCCASGLPMQIALNQLLDRAKPDRLLIEPTGLGHPLEVLQLLSNQYYQEVLSLEKTITLVDARKFSDKRYTEHNTFNQQLEVADIIIGNKADLYSDSDRAMLADYLRSKHIVPKNMLFTEYGDIPLKWLAGATQYKVTDAHHHHHDASNNDNASNREIPSSGFVQAVNEGEGFQSIGWRFAPNQIFDRKKLIPLLLTIDAIRVKAVFITSDGVFGYNNTSDGINEFILDECVESRIEIICDEVIDTWHQELQQAIIN